MGRTPRRGLVLGAGGVLGAAWTIGALDALAEVEGFEPSTVDVLVGTSAGSVLAALLGGGLSAADLLSHQRGMPMSREIPVQWNYEESTGGAVPTRPRLTVGSPVLLRRSLARPRQVPPLAVLAALAPPGSGTLAEVGAMVRAVAGPDGWAPRDGVWVVAMDYDSGRRVAFGRAGAPPARLDEAVTASSAIPGWYAPVLIDGRRYVDGGTLSSTSADLLAAEGLDEVYVLAPMATFVPDHPRHVAARLERRLRRQVTRHVVVESQAVARTGTAVTVLAPGPEDLAAMGANMMDPSRRLAVLETSLRTSRTALAEPRPDALEGTGSRGARGRLRARTAVRLMRVYLPTTLAGLGDALDAGRVDVAVGYAVTPALREWYVEGDLEELEYAASTAAARAALRLLAAGDGGGPARRVVLAVEVPDDAARPGPDVDRAAVRLAEPVPWSAVESALVDDPSAVDDVRRALAVMPAADAGDDDAAFVVGAVEDHELGWYAVQELSALVELEA